MIVPTQPLTVNGVQTTAWLQFDPSTGEIIAVGQNGGHQSISEFVTALNVAIAGGGFNVVFYYLQHPTNSTPMGAVKAFATGFLSTLIVELKIFRNGNFIINALLGGVLASRSIIC